MGSTKSILTNLGETLASRPDQFSFLSAALIEAPYSTIFSLQGGARKLPDPSKILRPVFGVEPIMFKSLRYIKTEKSNSSGYVYGVNGEQRVRLVGSWSMDNSNLGPHALSSVIGDYVEVTFYGTGLNLLLFQDGTARDFRVSIDGGAEGSNIYTTVSANVLNGRNLSINNHVNIANNLTLGTHTVKIRQNTGSVNFRIYGVEIINNSSSIQIPQGEAFVAGRKYTNGALSSISYNSGFDGNPVLNGRGGHVVEYMTPDGNIGKVIQQTNSSTQYLASADHTNEESIHITNWRDFSAQRSDDVASGTGNKYFTQEDNVTTMNFQGLAFGSDTGTVGVNGSGDYMNITFVGTGIDLVQNELPSTFTGTQEIVVNGTQIFNGNLGTIINRGVWKVVSGLPFGTHVLRYRKTAAGSGLAISDIIVYGPKKPTIPTNAIELQDYFLMADFDGSTITGTSVDSNIQMPVGVISKSLTREVTLVGANWSGAPAASYPNFGYNVTTLTANSQPYIFEFWGTGFVVHQNTHAGLTYDFSVSVDGALNASGLARSNASNLGGGSYRAASGPSGNEPVRIQFTGLTLGWHRVSIQRTGGSGNFSIPAFHIITPVYSPGIRNPQRSMGMGLPSVQDISDDDLNLGKAKAWVQFSGSSTPNIYSSHNVAGVLRNSTGDFTIFFKKSFKSDQYITLGSGEHNGGVGSNVTVAFTQRRSNSVKALLLRVDAGGAADSGTPVSLAFFGELEDEE